MSSGDYVRYVGPSCGETILICLPIVNLRYTVSECLFARPEQRISISNPCVVTCEPLADAIGYSLSNDSSNYNPSLGWCNAGQFDDTTINNCAFCYGLIPQQLFLANSKHIGCMTEMRIADPMIQCFNHSMLHADSLQLPGCPFFQMLQPFSTKRSYPDLRRSQTPQPRLAAYTDGNWPSR